MTTFIFENTDYDLAACVAETLDATAADLGERVDTSDNDARDSGTEDEVGARRGLAEVGTWLETDIYSSLLEEMEVGWLDGGDGIHLSMALTGLVVPPLTDYATIGDDDGADHGVRVSVAFATEGELQAAAHEDGVGR